MLHPEDLPVGAAAGRIYKEAIKAYEREADAIEWEKRKAQHEESMAARDRALKEAYQNEAKSEREMERDPHRRRGTI